MAAGLGERRLFVGGLGPSVTQDDVRAQLGRFGEVCSVELVSRVNELGRPEKTFAYANVRLSEEALRRCMSALNRTAWKGGTLRVQPARESFLHRLAKERLEAKAQQERRSPGAAPEKRAPELHMRAVPGTEVPGHKDWVVSKFGRVLPVLHLRSQNSRKVLKYDPSKYCHNLKKFEQDVTNTVSISDLTWKLEGGDDLMSKKRQGQFPAFRSHPSKSGKVGGHPCLPSKAVGRHQLPSPGPPSTAQQPQVQKAHSQPTDFPVPVSSEQKNAQKPEAWFLQTSKSPIVRSKNSMSDDDGDSEEETKALLAEEKSQRTGFPNTGDPERDSFEVVTADFKPGMKRPRSSAAGSNSAAHLTEDERDYDSGDTDEIIARGDNREKSESEQKLSPKERSKRKEKDFQKSRTKRASSCPHTETNEGGNSPGSERESANCMKSLPQQLPRAPPRSGSGESEEELEYESMMTNCYRLDLTLADLEKLANGDAQGPGGNATWTEQALPATQDMGSGHKTKKAPRKGARCIDPKDILASLLEGEEKISDRDPLKEGMSKSKFKAFRGVGALYGGETPRRPWPSRAVTTQRKSQSPLLQETSPVCSMGKEACDSNPCSSDEASPPQVGREADGANDLPPASGKRPRRQPADGDQPCVVRPPPSSSGSPSSLGTRKPSTLRAETCRMHLGSNGGLGTAEMGDPKPGRSRAVALGPPAGPESKCEPAVLKIHSKKPLKVSSRVQGKDPKGSREREPECPPCMAPADAISPPKNSQDNQKRLAALEERRRERELQKQLVHSALSSLDGHPANKPTHILFSSDSEDEMGENDCSENPHAGNGVKRDLASKPSGKLFESSEDEEQESEGDEARFQIKPQFEGKAGKKLMSLQSHFGADDRFRMDARFLETDSEEEEEEEEVKEAGMAEEEELAAEKKKNMEVIKNILHVSHQAPKLNKEERAAKQFRNIVRYDPTRLDHATFERKVGLEEKESKAKRRKKREEAEKLPQVSQDLYHSIAADLKERFRASEPVPGAGVAGPWNEAPEEMEAGPTAAPAAPDPATGLGDFTFSFFGPDLREVEEEPYKTEARPAGRMAWQLDPRFQDSSSEEDEEEAEPVDGSGGEARPQDVPAAERPTSRFFFFSESDDRLCVGPGLFWRGSGSQPSSEDWESRTLVLLQDCRKKHKAARRRAKP
ncbi:nucleolar protein 8 [Dromiciops gliroides]|uniref:nucleolar protein 8 n=1 Tax=Dromiciops gliroides TaxID=33562 RepID=UPI001CC45B35|nr:nucleolar protein 8 [Dromiciops gliroides]